MLVQQPPPTLPASLALVTAALLTLCLGRQDALRLAGSTAPLSSVQPRHGALALRPRLPLAKGPWDDAAVRRRPGALVPMRLAGTVLAPPLAALSLAIAAAAVPLAASLARWFWRPRRQQPLLPECAMLAHSASAVACRPAPLRTLGAKPYSGNYQSNIEGIAVTPDGSVAVTATSDARHVRFWDLRTGAHHELVEPKDEHLSTVTSLDISRDGRRLVTGSWDRTVRLWDLRTGELLQVWPEYPSAVAQVAFSVDGRRVVSGHWDTAVCLWDATQQEGQPLPVAPVYKYQRRVIRRRQQPPLPNKNPRGPLVKVLMGHRAPVTSVATSPDPNLVASGGVDNTVIVWDLQQARPVLKLMGHSDRVLDVAFTPDGQQVVSAGADGTIRLWDLATGGLRHTLMTTKPVRCVRVSADSHWVISGGDDCTVRIWDAHSGALQRVLVGHKHHVHAVAISLDQQVILSGGADRRLIVWDATPYLAPPPLLPGTSPLLLDGGAG